MKRIFFISLCLLLCFSMMAVPASAIFQVTYYNEEIYAGGILDLMAFVGDENLEDYHFQWQFAGVGSNSWVNLDENANYKGTKTNHLQVYTKVEADYEHWDEIPFRCLITKDGESDATPNIYMHILPYDSMLKAMKNKGIGLYEPSLTNVTGLFSKDDINYNATAYAGSNIKILCGGSTESGMSLLQNSDVQLKREIKITENGKYTVTGDQTSYIPYTVGNNAVKIELNMRIIMAGVDRGIYQTKTIHLTTKKPDISATGKTTSACSLLRHTYNESEKLASISMGTNLEIIRKEGSYYQVYYNGFVGYVGTSLVNAEMSDPKIIDHVQLRIAEPWAGNVWSGSVTVEPSSCYATYVEWYDKTDAHYLQSGERFVKGHDYQLVIWVSAKDGYQFKLDSSDKVLTTAILNGNLPCFTSQAYEQERGKVMDIRYDFNDVREEDKKHTCTPVFVPRVDPTCTEAGHEAYYYCSCGMCYKDAQGINPVDISTWGILPATGHTISDWRITGAYHYTVCTTCGEFLEQEDHTGGVASCAEEGKCTVCGYAYIETTEDHKPDTSQWIARGEMYHFHKCRICGAHCDVEDHRWSPKPHVANADGHAYQCADCMACSKAQPHNPGPAATETSPQTCKDCGYVIEPAKNHTHKLTPVEEIAPTCTAPGMNAHYICSGCSDRFFDKNATEKVASDEDLVIPPQGHQISNSWGSDAHTHWRICAVCGGNMIETDMEHDFQDGKCTVCAYESTVPQQTTAPTEPVSTEPVPTKPVSTEPAPSTVQPQPQHTDKNGMPWWGLLLIGLGAVSAGIGGGLLAMKLAGKKKRE